MPSSGLTHPSGGKRAFSVIDATPVKIGNELLLTYKTQHRTSDKPVRWRTIQRMLRLNPDNPEKIVANPVRPNGGSIILADVTGGGIEENPSLVKHGNRYTLFTSWGLYGTCDYHTRYRQNATLWTDGWQKKPTTRLAVPGKTCGSGNAQVVKGLPKDSWRIAFNGHPDKETAGGPDGLYIGALVWTKDGKPRIHSLLG